LDAVGRGAVLLMTGFDEVVVTRAFNPGTAPRSPLTLLERALTTNPGSCPACGVMYVRPEADGSWLASVCYPPSSDMPVPGHYLDIPAWCAQRQAFVWFEDGELVSDR
jgi:hypothetical protein